MTRDKEAIEQLSRKGKMCPFCGGGSLCYKIEDEFLMVHCENCLCYGPATSIADFDNYDRHLDDYITVLTDWNTRA